MNPRALDVQLLLVFDALMAERHVTNAARTLGLSQSALSHALRRLRERFDDPLLVRTPKGMEPTARALELAEPVRDAIRQVESVFASQPYFEPAESKERFVVRIGDTNEFLLLPAILTELAQHAPGVSLVVRHLSPADTIKGLEDGSVDFAVSALVAHPKSIRTKVLARDRMVCAMARSHPAAKRALTAERFLQLRHIRVAQDGGDTRFVEEQLRAQGLERTVVAVTPHLLAALHTVAKTELAISVPEKMARSFDRHGELVLHKLPFGGERFDWKLYWHSRQDARPAQRWMRELVVRAWARLEEPVRARS
jgi:DNA-binding transcriptional LysR family regulator